MSKESENNIVWHDGLVDYETRCKAHGQKGIVLWFTGLSGSGKSTIAVELEKKLVSLNKIVYRLDGDNVRHGLNSNLGFSVEDRTENIRRVSEVAKLFKDAAVITLVSFISPAIEMRKSASEIIGEEFHEIFVKASVETCIKRDTKGLYKKAIAGEIKNFTGISAPYEEPVNPDIIINTEKCSVDDAVNLIMDYLEKQKK
ncbi:adenylyl-sulfate kinase [bacterium]|nr:adenylyl-sulfate kinase [bacterium]